MAQKKTKINSKQCLNFEVFESMKIMQGNERNDEIFHSKATKGGLYDSICHLCNILGFKGLIYFFLVIAGLVGCFTVGSEFVCNRLYLSGIHTI